MNPRRGTARFGLRPRRHGRRLTAWRLGLTCWLLAVAAPCPALTGDKDQPIRIEADRVEIDDVKGVSVYQGNVRYTQGSMRLTADTVSLYYNAARTLERLEARGKPAHFRQRPDGQSEDVRAEAREIDYNARPERLVLRHDAHVWHQGDEFAGELIDYDIVKDTVSARKGPAGGGRVEIVIQPRPGGQGGSGGDQGRPDDAEGGQGGGQTPRP